MTLQECYLALDGDFARLLASGEKLTEALRDGPTPEAPALFAQVQADYRQTVDAIRRFQEELD